MNLKNASWVGLGHLLAKKLSFSLLTSCLSLYSFCGKWQMQMLTKCRKSREWQNFSIKVTQRENGFCSRVFGALGVGTFFSSPIITQSQAESEAFKRLQDAKYSRTVRNSLSYSALLREVLFLNGPATVCPPLNKFEQSQGLLFE